MTGNKIQHRYQTVLLYEQKLMNSKQAAESLNISERQFFRILNRFKDSERNIDSLKFKSHPAWNRSDKEIKKKVLKITELYRHMLDTC